MIKPNPRKWFLSWSIFNSFNIAILSTFRMTSDLGTYKSTYDGIGSIFKAVQILIQPTDVIRLLSAQEYPDASTSGFHGDVHFFGIWDHVFDDAQHASHYNGGVPNSVPSIKSSSSFATGVVNQEMTISLTGRVDSYDVDGDSITLKVTSLPTQGTLKLNGTTVTLNQFVDPDADLTYTQTTPDAYSTNDFNCSVLDGSSVF